MYNYDLDFTYDSDEDYQNNFLTAFGVKEYDEKNITAVMNELFEQLSKNEDFSDVFKKNGEQYMTNDPEMGFCFLFSYTHFKQFHDIIRRFHNTGAVDRSELDKLIGK